MSHRSHTPALPPRPAPRRDPLSAAAEWVHYIGVARLAAAALSAVAVIGAAWWLTRPAAPPVEHAVPFATPASAPTLPPPPTAVGVGEVYVHVAGAVTSPGVYRLGAGDRVEAAIVSAGGPTADADVDQLNLAAVVTDGARIYVPERGEVVEPAVGATASTTPGPIDLNRAGADELDTLPGIGPATAAAIVDDRNRNGPFATVDDLERVPGIGPAKLGAIRDLVTV